GWEDCLTESRNASRIFLDSAPYSIYKEGATPYLDLFNKMESDRTEVVLSRSYAAAIGLTHDCNGKFLSASMGRPGLTKDIVNSYLMSDGTRFTDVENFDKKLFTEEVQNRDPRLAQTIRTPGYCRKGTTDRLAPDFNVTTTGYHLVKYVAEPHYDSYNVSEQDMPIFRKAEICLNYAEACAELGTLTQDDLNLSLNLVRDRVGMPALDMATANANPDPYLDAPETGYPGVIDANKGVILEIRRERTIELINEGFRYWDLMRWKAAKRFERPFYGMYFPGVGSYDLDGDGVNDLVIYEGQIPSSTGTAVVKSLEELNLSGGTFGNVTVHTDIERIWDDDKDYLYPIPTEDRVLTQGGITQNPGWKDGLSF
ncbi:MAG: RagB/SusD family nutrient uptake outer membrane protein, partial [Bacteroidales bacterium]|nr:RagB/SusD family nutrient uptake outer membrane protein [Bacteroidales bacterium]